MKTPTFGRVASVLFTSLLLASAPLGAQPGAPAATPKSVEQPAQTNTARLSLSRSDYRLLKKIVESTDYEIALSRQAASQASNAQVRSYASTIVRDHERMNRELTTLIARRGAMSPTTPRQYEDVEELGKKSGSDYDEEYLEDMVESHEDAVKRLEKASRSKDSDFAAFGTQYLSTLRDHLARARELEKAFD